MLGRYSQSDRRGVAFAKLTFVASDEFGRHGIAGRQAHLGLLLTVLSVLLGILVSMKIAPRQNYLRTLNSLTVESFTVRVQYITGGLTCQAVYRGKAKFFAPPEEVGRA